MRIALDAMGGDFAPRAIVEGAILAKNGGLKPESQIVLVGQKSVIIEHLNALGSSENDFEIIHADQVIEMGEHPTKAISQKPNSSIMVGLQQLKAKEIDAFCSCGNTGAMLVGSMFTIRPIDGIIRPGIGGYFPKLDGYGIVIDVGANADCKPDVLEQYAQLGSIYVQYIMNKPNPKVGLLNLGTEEGKGSLLTQATYELLKTNDKINFVGNLEGRDFFNDKADVIVCDGFTGNVVLKMGEEFYEIMKEQNNTNDFVNKFDYSHVGGNPILGVNGNVIVGHGISNPTAVVNMLRIGEATAENQISEKIKKSFK